MKDSVLEITTAVDALMQMTEKFDRGQIISWDEIEKIAGDRTENRSKYIIKKWLRRLEKEREIVTLCAVSIGVRLLTHRETATEIPKIRQRRAYRQIRRGIRQTKTVDPSRLSLHERRLLVVQQQNMADARRELFRSQKQLSEGLKPTETNPRRKLPTR